ncbi:MAG: DUF1302 family protein [Candidatus Omnitrophota bacterium]
MICQLKSSLVIFIILFFILSTFAFAQESRPVNKNEQGIAIKEVVMEVILTRLSQKNKAKPIESNKKFWSRLGLDEKYFGLHGYMETRNYYHFRRNNDYYYRYELRDNLRISKEFNFSKELHGMASLDGRVFYFDNSADGFKRKESRFEPWEIYLDYYGDKLNLRVGQQLMRWGKSDEVNPTDVFSPEDLSEFFNEVERAKRKLPVFAVKTDAYFKNYSLETFWLPFFRKTRLDAAGNDWEPYLFRYYRSLGLRFLDDHGPSKRVEHSSFAAKIKREGENSDLSLSYSYHYAETPALEINPLLLEVSSIYPRQHTIGSDFETVIGKFGLRTEGALTTKTPFLSYDPQVPSTILYKNALNYIIGADYTLPSDLYINLQYTQQYIFNYSKDLATQQSEDSIVWRISQNLRHETIVLKTTGRYFLSTKDLLFEASLLYKFTDNFNLTTGLYLFDGQDNGTFGQYKKNDQLFARLKYSF